VKDISVFNLHKDVDSLNAIKPCAFHKSTNDCCPNFFTMRLVGCARSRFIGDALFFSQACRFCFGCLPALSLDSFLLLKLGALLRFDKLALRLLGCFLCFAFCTLQRCNAIALCLFCLSLESGFTLSRGLALTLCGFFHFTTGLLCRLTLQLFFTRNVLALCFCFDLCCLTVKLIVEQQS
jgi:hypothetical protein